MEKSVFDYAWGMATTPVSPMAIVSILVALVLSVFLGKSIVIGSAKLLGKSVVGLAKAIPYLIPKTGSTVLLGYLFSGGLGVAGAGALGAGVHGIGSRAKVDVPVYSMNTDMRKKALEAHDDTALKSVEAAEKAVYESQMTAYRERGSGSVSAERPPASLGYAESAAIPGGIALMILSIIGLCRTYSWDE